MEKLEESLGDDALYNTDNVILSATHTHSGPGGYMQYVLFQFTSYGFVQQSFQALVDGISRVILFYLEYLDLEYSICTISHFSSLYYLHMIT